MGGTTNGQAIDLGRQLVTEVLEPMKHAFVGKDVIVDLMGVALVAGENLFLLGPPGTAKSALVYELGRRLHGQTFEYLLTRFTEPNELFGPFDIRKLREGELITNTEGMLPEASLVFLDELLNANSAILNSLLMVLNERVFRRGRENRPLPTLLVIGASNRLPEDDALGALFDRFLLRVMCENVPADRLTDVLDRGWKLNQSLRQPTNTFDIEHIRTLQNTLLSVRLDEIRKTLADLIIRLRNAGLAVSDRRAVKIQRLAAASALLCGRDHAIASDLWVVRHMWDTIEQQETLAAIVDDVLKSAPADETDHPRARPDGPDPEALARDLEEIELRLKDGQPTAADVAQMRDRLSLLAGRSQWVADTAQRDFLVGKVESLWKAIGREQ